MDLQLNIKHGPKEHPVTVSANSTVLALKQQLESLTGVFVRNQKLIFKGKVLDDAATLEASKIGKGAKLMLLATEGLPFKVRCRDVAAAKDMYKSYQ